MVKKSFKKLSSNVRPPVSMGGGLSKKKQNEAASRTARPPPPHAVNPQAQIADQGWEVEHVRDDGWEPIPYGLLLPDDRSPSTPRRACISGAGGSFVPFDTPNGGAGVGSLRPRHLEEHHTSTELSELPPTALSLDVLEVGGLNDSATPVHVF